MKAGIESLFSRPFAAWHHQSYNPIKQHQFFQSKNTVYLSICFCCLQFLLSVPYSFQSIDLLSPSAQFSHSVVSDSLRPYESQHARPPCPSPTTGVHPNSSASSQWCHPAISFSVVPLSSCPQSLPVSGSFPMSQLFAWNGQSIGVSALASAICM